MQVFIDSAANAKKVQEANVPALDALLASTTDVAEAREYLYSLIDAYNADVQVSAMTYRQAIMLGIVRFLSYADSCGEAVEREHEAQLQSASRVTAPKPRWMLSTEDCLMLALFFSELATVTDQTLFASLCEAIVLLVKLALPAAYGAPHGLETGVSAEKEQEAQTSLQAELEALRTMLFRRLVSTVEELRKASLSITTLLCLRGILFAHRDALLSCGNTLNVHLLHEAALRCAEELLAPLHQALQEQVWMAQQVAREAAESKLIHPSSPLLLATVLYHLEDILWTCDTSSASSSARAEGEVQQQQQRQPSPSAAHAANAVMCDVSQHIVSDLLAILSKYLGVQQSKPMSSGGSTGAAAEGGSALAGRDVQDVFRVYTVQRATQRVLSVAVTLASQDCLPATLRGGAVAALTAFGGPIPVENPKHFALAAAADEDEAKETWRAEPGQEGSRLRECLPVLLASRPCDLTGGAEADLDGLDEEALLTGGAGGFAGKDAPLRSSLGPVPAAALADMVIASLSTLRVLDDEAVRARHVEGLHAMQLGAARRAQREELERLRTLARQGIEAIPAGRLTEHVKDAARIREEGTQTLRRPSARARLEKAAFSSVLRAYEHVKGEAEGSIRTTQALIARCLVQLPPSLTDAALDELCLRLRDELQAEFKLRQAKQEPSLISRGSSYYQLTLQVLFMYYTALAPVREREASPLMLLGGGLAEDGLLGRSGGDGSSTAEQLRSRAVFHIDADNPISFIYDDDTPADGISIGLRRPRDPEEDTEDARGAAGDVGGFRFYNDSGATPSAYSHVLCRVMELVEAAKLNTVLLDVLLQAPVITRYVWHYLYVHFCLSAEKTRCVIGLWLLTNLAIRRPVCRTYSVNLMLHLCMNTNEYARRLAIKQIGTLLSSTGADGSPVISPEAESLLLRYSKKQLAAVPAYRLSSAALAANSGGAAAVNSDAEDATHAKEVKKVHAQLNRHLGLFLMLCVRHPAQLFTTLLDVFRQCVERDNTELLRLLPTNADVRLMAQYLLKSNPPHFISTVMPLLRRYSKDATLLVQYVLAAVSEQLRDMAAEAGPDSPRQEELRVIASALLGHAKAMFMLSSLPLGGGAEPADRHGETPTSAAVLHDIRFVVPFLSFVPTAELRAIYLPAFLYFVQVQLQLQRQHHHGIHSLTGRERSYVLTVPELHALMTAVVREVVVKSLVQFTDDIPRGMSRVEFLVYIHRAPHESARAAAASRAAAAAHHGGGGAPGGILDAPADLVKREALAEAEGWRSTAPHGASTLPPIGVVTVKEVVALCLELTRTFNEATVERLYGPAETQKAIKKLMHPPPVPSQLMATVIMAAAKTGGQQQAEFVRFVVQTVLIPLERASTWAADPQLWKGVLYFAEQYYQACGSFLVNLPDQVLLQALQARPQLCAYFKAEHGNNASFGHILGNL